MMQLDREDIDGNGGRIGRMENKCGEVYYNII